MNTTSLDARTVMQPGGLYEGVNNALLQGLMAYFQSKDRERQGERDMRREERVMGRQQLADALAQAERYGVAPDQADMGWAGNDKAPLIEAAVNRFKQAQREKLLADMAAGKAQPSQTRDEFYAGGLRDVPADLQAEWSAADAFTAQQEAAQQKAAKDAAESELNRRFKEAQITKLGAEAEKESRPDVAREPGYISELRQQLALMDAAAAAKSAYQPPNGVSIAAEGLDSARQSLRTYLSSYGAPTASPAPAGAAGQSPSPQASPSQNQEVKTATMAEINEKTDQKMKQDPELAALGFERARQRIIDLLRMAGYTLRP